jgi:arylsulfatase A-like enzyme
MNLLLCLCRRVVSVALLLVAGALSVPHCLAAEIEQNRFNVLMIAIDDLRPELGCYGVAAAQSPNLDALARESVLFERHYVQVPTCGASRFALLTGRSPATSGVSADNAALYSGASALLKEQQAGAQSLPELFRRSGYRTVCIGKISHTADGRVFEYNGKGDGRDEVPHGWDELATPFGSWKRGWGIFFAYSGGRSREDGGGHRDLMEFTVEKDSDLPDGQLADAAIEQLQGFQKSGQRFFLGLGFFKPHLPFVAPRQDWDAIVEEDVALPELDDRIDSPYWHASGEFYKYEFPFEKNRPLDDASQKAARRAYLACVRYVDRQVGRVLDSLRRLKLEQETVVVVWGDHGWHLGEQQIWGKHSPFERAVRSALIVRVPGVSRAGLKTNALAETVDLYPTLVDVCAPEFQKTHLPLDGVSLTPVLSGKSSSVRDAAVSYWRDAVSIRTVSHRLIARRKAGKVSPVALYELADQDDSNVDIAKTSPAVVERMLKLVP